MLWIDKKESRKGISTTDINYEIKSRSRWFGPNMVTTYEREFCHANILNVEAGTTGYKGGDSGHGGITYFRISDLGGTDIEVRPVLSSRIDDEIEGFEVKLGGDSELDTIILALKFIVDVLESQRKNPREVILNELDG